MKSPQTSHPKRVLFVCLGNICRSPAAEGVFLQLLSSQGLEADFRVDSAGTGSWHVGRPADARMRAAAGARGIDLPSRARQIELADLQRFDWILTMDHDNRHQVQSLAQTLGSRATAQIRCITSYCQQFDADHIPDPYYGGEDGFEHVLDLLEDACDNLLRELRAQS
jgi:protein-tyrosine phosphatase